MESPIPVVKTIQPGGATLTEDASTDSFDVSGAQRALIWVRAGSGTAGIMTFEHSFDNGVSWEQCNEVLDTLSADGSAPVLTTPAAPSDVLYKVDPHSGPCLIRARISTAWVTSAPEVRALAIF